LVHPNQDSFKKIPAAFFKTEFGNEPVREWLKEMTLDDRRLIGTDIRTVEYGWPIGMPTRRAMGAGLYEVRTSLGGNRIARVMFCISASNMVLLHGLIKKTGKTSPGELRLARKRQRMVEAYR
jgi:phage-related protein